MYSALDLIPRCLSLPNLVTGTGWIPLVLLQVLPCRTTEVNSAFPQAFLSRLRDDDSAKKYFQDEKDRERQEKRKPKPMENGTTKEKLQMSLSDLSTVRCQSSFLEVPGEVTGRQVVVKDMKTM